MTPLLITDKAGMPIYSFIFTLSIETGLETVRISVSLLLTEIHLTIIIGVREIKLSDFSRMEHFYNEFQPQI